MVMNLLIIVINNVGLDSVRLNPGSQLGKGIRSLPDEMTVAV